jgi:hypothetical protein
MVKTRRLAPEITVESGLPQNFGLCRKCQKIKKLQDFYKATDLFLDSNGHMSVCKDCINTMYVSILDSEHGSISKTILRMCRMLNVKYDESAISSALEHTKIREADETKLFGFYRLKLLTNNRTDVSDTSVDLTYKDSPVINMGFDKPMEYEVSQDVIDFWGEGFETSEYEWLEKTLDGWKKTHKCDTKAEEVLFREIVFKQFEIEKARKENSSTSSLIKELQDIMKTASVDPAKANVAGAGKSQDTFSAFIKMIEENEPAEVFGDEREAFKDFQGIEKYFYKYVVRSIKNFITGSRDFNLDAEEDEIEGEIEEYEPLNYNPEESEQSSDDNSEEAENVV